MRKYVDRWGKQHTPAEDSIIKPRAGIFAVFIARDHILLSWGKWAPDVPELPGGGIDAGESLEQALKREIAEEADLYIEALKPQKTLHKDVGFYADYDEEFWDYSQTYWLLSEQDSNDCFFEGEKHPKDALKSGWVPLEDIKNIGLHAIHAETLGELL